MDINSNRLKKGINQDIHPSEQPENTYRGALNIVPLSEDGNIYSISNEDGTTALDRVTLPDGKKVIGHAVLNNDIILILAGEDGSSQVGYVREDTTGEDLGYGLYKPVAPYNPDGATPAEQYPQDNSEFNFTISYPVDCVARKIIDGSRILYFTDNNNPFGRINLDNPPEVGQVLNQSQLVFDQRVPKIEIEEIIEEVTGDIPPGIYQFIPRYITENGGVTTFGIPSDPIAMVPSIKKDGVSKYSGEYPSYGTVNKNISLSISNVDLNYQELEIIVAFYTEAGVFNALSIGKVPITSDTIDFLFTTISSGEETAITREEIRQVPVSYKKAKAIEQKDNTLFLSNLKSDEIDDTYLQKVANNITVSYEIEELDYSGREGNTAASDTPTVDLVIESATTLRAEFSSTVEDFTFTTGSNNLSTNPITYGEDSQLLSTITTVSSAIISAASPTTGDTITIDNSAGSTDSFTYASTVSSVNEFSSAQSLADTINNNDDLDYIATISGTDVTLYWNGAIGTTKTITYTGTVSGSSEFTGGDDTERSISPESMVKSSDNVITFTFEAGTRLTPGDLFFIESVVTDSGTASVSQYLSVTTASSDSGSTGASAEGFTDYVDEIISNTKRGYRRGEVYSLGFMLLFKDGTTSFVYHIPGNDKGTVLSGKTYPDLSGDTYRVGSTSGELGTYLSDLEYPLDQNFPGTEDGDDIVSTVRKIRHHVMPRLDQEPHFRQVDRSNAKIRVLGLKFEIDPAFDIPSDLKEKVEEIIFVRERRSSSLNRSINSQGLINRLVESADHFETNGTTDGINLNPNGSPNIRSNSMLQEMPFFNNLESIHSRSGDQLVVGGIFSNASGYSLRGISYPGDDAALLSQSRDIRGDRAFFHTPESILKSSVNLADLTQSIMKPVLRLTGDAEMMKSSPNKFRYSAGLDYCEEYAYHYMHGNYTTVDTSYVYDTVNNEGDRRIEAIVNREPGIRRNPALLPEDNKIGNVSTRWTQGGWEVKVANDTVGSTSDDFISSGGSSFSIDHEVFFEDKAELCATSCSGSNEGGYILSNGTRLNEGSTATIANHLYNSEIINLSQYGQLALSSYIPCGRFKIDATSFDGVYSGDTFITKFAVNTAGLVCYYPFNRDAKKAQNRPFKTSPGNGLYHPVSGEADSGTKGDGYDLRSCHYFFVESNINTNYRHRPIDETVQNYFPNEIDKRTNLQNFFGYAGNINAYNDLYSYENNIKEFFIKGSTQTVVSNFENRTIYSEQAFEDTVVDSYRNFLVRNYYDLPSHTGPIWDTFVHANTLYMHTPKSCWRTFAEPAATLQGGNLSEVILGTGTLFARPSQELLTTGGGYAGSISQYGGVHTHMGYMFPDVLQGKIFLLGVSQGGPQLNDLSLQGLYTFCHKSMKSIITTDGEVDLKNVTSVNSNLIDNPYNNIGFTGGYDFKLRRAWIVKKGEGEFTLSYSSLMQNWTSFHSYSPEVIIPFDNRVLFIKSEDSTSKFWEMNIGEKGSYFNNVYNSEIELSVPTVENQTFNNQSFHADIRNNEGRKLKDDFFNTVQVYTDRQNSNSLPLISGNGFAPTKLDNEVFYKFRNDEYRVAIPRDSVKDNDLDIFDLTNIYEPLGGTAVTDSKYPIRPRIKGDYAIFKYVYQNESSTNVSKDNSFVLREIRTIFENNIR